MSEDEIIVRVVKAIAGDPGQDTGVNPDELFFFRKADGSVQIAANCNDMFDYATADCEEITADNIGVFEQAVRDVAAADLHAWYGELFAVRIRKRLPLKPRIWNADTYKCWAMYEAAVGGER